MGVSLGVSLALLSACSGDGTSTGMEPDNGPGPMPLPPAPACTPASGGGGKTVSAPELLLTLKDRYEEAWLGSAAVADVNGD